MELFATFLSSTLYAAAISVGYGKRMDDDIVTRPLVVAGGVAIVIAGYSASKRDGSIFRDLFLWFAVAALPLMLRSALLGFFKADSDALEAHRIIP